MKLRSSGELENINVQVFKKHIDDIYKHRCKSVKIPNVYNLDDLANRLERLSALLQPEPKFKPGTVKFAFSESEVKPYLKLDSVSN